MNNSHCLGLGHETMVCAVCLAMFLTHWGRVAHICVDNMTLIGSDNGLSPGRRQAIIWTNAGILLFRPLGTNFNEILIGNQTRSFKKIHLKMSSAKWRPFCLGLNVLTFGYAVLICNVSISTAHTSVGISAISVFFLLNYLTPVESHNCMVYLRFPI